MRQRAVEAVVEWARGVKMEKEKAKNGYEIEWESKTKIAVTVLQ